MLSSESALFQRLYCRLPARWPFALPPIRLWTAAVVGFAFFGWLLIEMNLLAADGAVTTHAEADTWALAIHGGAGGDPAKWGDEKRQARQAGMRAALQAGRDALSNGAEAMDVVERVIRMLEDDAHFNAGRGAVLTSEGRAELDASIMDGRTGACGAVGGVRSVKNPITLARRVMTETRHVLLVGDGAEAFAAEQQVERVPPEYFLSWRDAMRNRDVAPLADPTAQQPPHFGTVGCVVLDKQGNLAAGTSTGGLSDKLPGRIGDSPIVGAGTYAANDSCAVSGTGVGEEFIRHAVAYDVAAQMRYAHRSLPAAVDRIIRQTLKPGVGGLIAVGADGTIVMQHNTPGMTCGAADSGGRFDVYLAVPAAPEIPTPKPQ